MKLSPAQQTLVGLLKNGYKLHWMSGLHSYAFLSPSTTAVKNVTATVFALESRGIIERTERQINGNAMFKLTAKGRAL
jgi:hypothetical protein